MSNSAIEVWNSPNGLTIPSQVSEVSDLVQYNYLLTPREVKKVEMAYNNGLFDMALEYIWSRTIAVLRERVMSLGEDFVMEMLGTEKGNTVEISDVDVINLAADLGFINKRAKLLFSQTLEIIKYYTSRDAEEEMDKTEVQRSMKVCFQYVLGIEQSDFEFSFNNFRNKLKLELINDENPLYINLMNSPYFYKRTTVRTLLNLSRSSKGGERDNVLANMTVLIPGMWDSLLSDDRWPIGIAYSEAVNNSDKPLVAAFKSVLMKKHGFDYVPENLRSLSFIEYGKKLIDMHNSFDNFYKEPAAAKSLASLGTSIPTPALGVCITASLAVKLGNYYGVSWNAQEYVDTILDSVTQERWLYYFNQVFPGEELILIKLINDGDPITRWIEVINKYALDDITYKDSLINSLMTKSKLENKSEIKRLAKQFYNKLR